MVTGMVRKSLSLPDEEVGIARARLAAAMRLVTKDSVKCILGVERSVAEKQETG